MKENMLLLTGWGASHHVWNLIIPALETCCQINNVIPPWSEEACDHGSLSHLDEYVDKLAETYLSSDMSLSASTNQSAGHVLAWSLGGLIAIRLAERHPNCVKSIVFIASTPKFVSPDNLRSGIDFDKYLALKKNFDANPSATIKSFRALQAVGDKNARPVLKQFRSHGDGSQYSMSELQVGLDLLETDFSEQFLSLACSKYFILGADDAIVNCRNAEYFAQQSQSEWVSWPQAGHAPMMSCPNKVAEQVSSFLNLGLSVA